jgi:hypothetical protein
MKFRVFALGALGLVSMMSLHGCSSDYATPPPGGGGGSSARGGTAGSGGAKASAGTAATTEGGHHGGRGGSASGGTTNAGAAEDAGAAPTETAGRDGGSGGGGLHGGSGTHAGASGGKGGSFSKGGTNGAAGEAGAAAGAWANAGVGAGGEAENGGEGGDWHGGGPHCVDDLALPLVDTPPATLDQTGLYTSPNAAPDDIAPYVYEFTPRYPLWSDGATKRRFMYLPKCTQIDTSDMNHWKFPVGTRFWKEFTFEVGSSPVRVETRFIHHYGPGDSDWLFVAYQWDPSVSSATAGNTAPVPNGVVNANGTQHDIPTQSQCLQCHSHLPEHILGFSAFELTSNPGSVTIGLLSQEQLITVPAPNGFDPPGSSVQQDGLGYLHANCGVCHNAYFSVTDDPAPQMRLLVEQTTLESTDTYTTLVNVPVYNDAFAGMSRVVPGDPADSEIIVRMSQRGSLQMPPIATEVVDTDGVAKISAFIDSLTP